jgi:signal transduction histidine kinase/HAMP domain-containing protein
MSKPENESRLSTGSLRLRFLLATMLWVGLGVGGIWFAAISVFERHIEEMYHEELEVHVRELARLTELDATGRPQLTRPLSDPRFEVPLSGFYWQVSVPDRPVLRSDSMTRGTLDAATAYLPEIVHTLQDGPTGPTITYGLLERGPAGEAVHVLIATDQSELDEDIASFTDELSLWLAALAALLLGTGFAVIDFGLRPLARLGEAVNRLREGGAGRLEGNYPAEIVPLVTDLNEYVSQNNEIVSRARVQAGNLAHSLRTPLAILTDEAERLMKSDCCATSGRVLLTQATTMQQQIDYQLARARSAAGAKVPGSRAVLPDLAVPILNAMRRLHPDKQFEMSPLAHPIALQADPVNLSELFSILLDNAGKWAKSNVRLSFDAQTAGPSTISITDDGPGMTRDEISKACEVGTRFDPAKPGAGLGLAMALDICENLGATLEFSRGDGGLAVVVRLPAMRLSSA